jgi:hypothetical protein
MIEMMSGTPMGSFGLVMMLIFAVLIILPFWFIFSKAGFPRWLSLLMVVPIVNLIMLYVFAFSDWPSMQKKNNE